MPIQAIPLALIASIYPFGLAALLLLFQARRPKGRSLAFLAGAAVCTLTVGFLIVFVLRSAGLHQSSNQTARYGLQIGLGVLLLLGAWVFAHRAPKPADAGPSRITRTINESGLWAVFIVGVALYTPSPAYLSALQVVGTTDLSNAATVAWVLIVVFLLLITIEVPIALYFLAPAWTIPKLAAVNQWLERNGRVLFTVVLTVLGAWEIIAGLIGVL